MSNCTCSNSVLWDGIRYCPDCNTHTTVPSERSFFTQEELNAPGSLLDIDDLTGYTVNPDSEKKKWEFRYNNQDKRIKDLEDIVTELRKTIRGLRREIKDGQR